MPGGEQPRGDRLQRHARVQPQREAAPATPAAGREHALVEAEPLEAAAGDADAAVGGGPADGALALAAGLGDDLAGEVGGGGEQEGGECRAAS